MDPAPRDPAEHLRLLRQQLLLAQVRVMEMEDESAARAARVADAEKLLADAQRLADAKLDESVHLTRTLGDLQQQFQHLRHMQHLTNEALEQTRASLAAAGDSLKGEQGARAAAESAAAALQSSLAGRESELQAAAAERDRQAAEAAARAARIGQLDSEIRTMKSSASWRWTAWLRSLARAFGRR